MAIHQFTHDLDRCTCGGEWVYFDHEATHGCEVAGPHKAQATNVKHNLDDHILLNEVGRAQCENCGSTVKPQLCQGLGTLCERCSLECDCDACLSR